MVRNGDETKRRVLLKVLYKTVRFYSRLFVTTILHIMALSIIDLTFMTLGITTLTITIQNVTLSIDSQYNETQNKPKLRLSLVSHFVL